MGFPHHFEETAPRAFIHASFYTIFHLYKPTDSPLISKSLKVHSKIWKVHELQALVLKLGQSQPTLQDF